jgi:signal transduction histidine kinase
MGHLAKVTSIDVIEHFAAALKCFGEDAKTALDGIDMEVRRALNWIQREQKDYWTRQIRRNWDEVNIARKELERKMMFYPGDDRPSCHDERLALEAAKRRLRLAQEKVEAVKRWSHRAEREVNEYIGAVQVLKRWMEFDLPQAQADLARMARALEDYVALESSAGPSFPDSLGALIGSAPATAATPPDETASSRQPETPARTEDTPTTHQPETQAKSVEDEQEKADG